MMPSLLGVEVAMGLTPPSAEMSSVKEALHACTLPAPQTAQVYYTREQNGKEMLQGVLTHEVAMGLTPPSAEMSSVKEALHACTLPAPQTAQVYYTREQNGKEMLQGVLTHLATHLPSSF
eukprot:COSAG01_NODE_31262_length_600_cov_38.031936_1_plen_119_part_01